MDKSHLKKLIQIIAGAQTVFYIMPAFILLLIIGTIAQKWIGLYTAHKIFFASFILWAGPVPLPSGLTILAILTLSLLTKFLFASPWSLKKSGIILSHLGALIILIGGLVTSITAKEGFMILPEGGDPSPYIYDYNKRELFIFKNERLHTRVPFDHLNNQLQNIKTPFAITILNKCANCDITKRDPDTIKDEKSMAAGMQLINKPSELEPEQNFSGTTFRISGTTNQDENGTYVAFENMPKPIEITDGETLYKIMYGKQQRILPFSLSLIDFVKTDYPGTNTAKAFHADITIHDKALEWPTRIEMNAPLRYKGYTFYQSSFQDDQNQQATILAVVENQGVIFPYIGTILMALGLIIHAIIRRDTAQGTA